MRSSKSEGVQHHRNYLSPFHQAILDVATRIGSDEITRQVWDQPPTVWGIDKGAAALTGRHVLTAWELPLDGTAWRGVDRVAVLMSLAAYLRHSLSHRNALTLRQRRVCAVALAAEEWVLDFPPDASVAERQEAAEFSQRRGVADHPWGVEAKTVTAVSTDGWRYSVVRHRTTGDGPTFAEPGDGGITSRYSDALDQLLLALHPRVT